ncbi:MAG: nucleotide exchange factor GrpE [Clostridiales bacterium]|jgi:molecular chaperone GrpE|nr:nucleotide exchange factor GrpE [Clostridiales bacterium]
MTKEETEEKGEGKTSLSSRKKEETGHPEEPQNIGEDADEIEFESVKESDRSEQKTGPKPAEAHLEESRSLKSKLRKKDADIKSLKKDIEEFKDKYLRALAEMENLRKRADREKVEFRNYALAELLRELLVVLDNFERALKSRDQTDGRSFQEGVEMIYRMFLDLLMKNGVAPIVIDNKKFDPNLHQAVLTEESDEVEEPEVAEELQRGYRLHGRLLRPSLVKVLVPKKKDTP